MGIWSVTTLRATLGLFGYPADWVAPRSSSSESKLGRSPSDFSEQATLHAETLPKESLLLVEVKDLLLEVSLEILGKRRFLRALPELVAGAKGLSTP
jgi:hypothetical protein